MKIKVRKVENGFIVSIGKKEYYRQDEVSARETVKDLFMAEIAPGLAEKEANKLFPKE